MNNRIGTYCSNAGVISQHEATHTVAHGYVRASFRQRDLNACWAPGNKSGEPAFTDTQQTLVHVGRIDFTLDDIEDGDVTTLLAWDRGDHSVLRLQQSPHDVQHCSLSHRLCLFHLVTRKGRVSSHQKVASGRRNERG